MNKNNENLEFLKNENVNIFPLMKNQKIPAVRWELYQEAKFSFDALLEHYNNNNYGAICGSISDNLVVFDFDLPKEWKEAGNYLTNEEVYELYKKIINSIPNIPLDTYIVKTPSGGLHFYFKLESMDIYKKLKQNKGLNCKFKLERVNIDHLDIQGEGKYVVIPPSSIEKKKYEVYNNSPIFKINDQLFETFLSNWTNPANLKEKDTLKNKKNELRKPLQAIALGEIIIEKYGIEHNKTGGEEFAYWDAFIRECVNNAFSNDEIHHLLKETQPNYDFKETDGHIKWIRRKKTLPLTNETLGELFPEYQLPLSENREKLYDQFYNETKTTATYPAKGGVLFEKKDFKKWHNKKKKKKEINLNNIDNIDDLIRNLTHDTPEKTIITILKKVSNFEPDVINNFILTMIEKNGREKSWFNDQLEIIYVENLAKEHNIDLNLLSITRKQISLLASKLDLNRPGSITGFFLAFKKNCNLTRESICLTLLPNIEDFMNKIIKKYPMFILDKTNYIYLYNEVGVYIKENKKPEEIIEELVINEIPFYVKQVAGDVYFIRRVKTITKEIIIRSYIKEDLLDFDIINVKNGILKISDIKNKKWILYPHNYQFKSVFQLNINFNPFITTKNKILLNTLKLRLGEQLIHLFKLYSVALLGKPYQYKIITFLVGPSGTGKSEVILRILEYIIGDLYIAHGNIHFLCAKNTNFESGLLQDVLINTNGDIAGGPLEDPSEINRLTEKKININKKHGFKGSILNTISHFYACNRMPIIADTDRKDIMRRFYTIDVRGDPIPENKRNPDYFDNLIKSNPGEIEHLFGLIISNLSIVLNDKDLKLPSIDERKNKYFRLACPLFSFVNLYIINHPTNKETKPSETFLINRNYFLEIYNQYRKKINYEPYESTYKLTAENDSLKYEMKLWTRQKDYKKIYIGVEFNPEAIKEFKINLEKSIENKLIYKPDIEKKSEEKNIDNFLKKNNQDNEKKINDVIERIIEIFNDNNNKPCFRNNIIQGLELDYEKEYIEIAFNRMYNNNRFEKGTNGIKLRT